MFHNISNMASLFNSILFIFECFHDLVHSTEKHCEGIQPGHDTVKIVFLFLVQNCVNFSRWLLYQKSVFYTEQWKTPSPFTSPTSTWNHTLYNYGFLWDVIKFLL